VDPSRPSPARVYDYLLGGQHNFESDRAAAEVVRRVIPGARVVCVDNDPLVLAHGGELLRDDPSARVILADIRDPDAVLGDPGLRAVIDLTQPVGLLLTAVLHFVSDESDPHGLVRRYVDALVPGNRQVARPAVQPERARKAVTRARLAQRAEQ
jgi:S-adenosyl methyltransferase